MRNVSRLLIGAFCTSTIFLPSSLTSIGGSAFAADKSQGKPASKEDLFLYRGMGGSYLCNALSAGVEFPKAVGIASATYVQVLEGKHGGKVSSVGKQKLTRDKLFAGAEFQIITAAIQFCPDNVPKEVKKKISNILENDKSNQKANKKKRK